MKFTCLVSLVRDNLRYTFISKSVVVRKIGKGNGQIKYVASTLFVDIRVSKTSF